MRGEREMRGKEGRKRVEIEKNDGVIPTDVIKTIYNVMYEWGGGIRA